MAASKPAAGGWGSDEPPSEHPFLGNNRRTGSAGVDADPHSLPLAFEPDTRQGSQRSSGIALRDVAVLSHDARPDTSPFETAFPPCQARQDLCSTRVPCLGGLRGGLSACDLSTFSIGSNSCPSSRGTPNGTCSSNHGRRVHRERGGGSYRSQNPSLRHYLDSGLRPGTGFQSPERANQAGQADPERPLLRGCHGGGIAGSAGITTDIWRRIRINKDERYQFLQRIGSVQDAAGQDLPELGIDFKRYFTIPADEVYRRIELGEAQRRCVLNSPYLEHFCVRFANYLSRVALPADHLSE